MAAVRGWRDTVLNETGLGTRLLGSCSGAGAGYCCLSIRGALVHTQVALHNLA